MLQRKKKVFAIRKNTQIAVILHSVNCLREKKKKKTSKHETEVLKVKQKCAKKIKNSVL